MSQTPITSPTSNTPLIELNNLDSKQTAIKGQIANQQYRSLAGILLSLPSYWIRKRKHRVTPLPFWYKAFFFLMLSLTVALIVEILLGNPTEMTNAGIVRLWIELVALTVSSLVVIVGVRIHNILLEALRECVLNSISREEDLVHFNQWLLGRFNLKRQIMSALPLGILLIGICIIILLNIGINIDLAIIIVMALYGSQIASVGPAINNFFLMLQQLFQYHLRLYSADPSSSKMTVYLSGSISSIILMLGIISAISTLVSFFVGLLNTLFYILALAIPWFGFISLFAIGHHALSRIIIKAKQQRLDEIQAKIQQIEKEQDISNKETLEAINRLADYHNRIKSTRNSAIDISVVLRFLQSLLLPLIASLLGSIGQIIQFLSP